MHTHNYKRHLMACHARNLLYLFQLDIFDPLTSSGETAIALAERIGSRDFDD